MLPRVFLGDNLCACGMQPFVATGMIEMPMGVDKVRDRIGSKTSESLGDLGARDATPASMRLWHRDL
jgi:hypothetical protein